MEVAGTLLRLNSCYPKKKKGFRAQRKPFVFGSGGGIRTRDLWVMSPTSYQLLHPAIVNCFKDTKFGVKVKFFLSQSFNRLRTC